MRYTYEFEFYPGEEYLLAVPFDFDGGTFGDGPKDTAEMAADWLIETINDYLLQQKQVPIPTYGNQPEKNGLVALVSVDTSLESIKTVFACDAAEMLGVTRARVTQLLNKGLLEGYRKGRTTNITLDSIKARLEDAPKAGRPVSARNNNRQPVPT